MIARAHARNRPCHFRRRDYKIELLGPPSPVLVPEPPYWFGAKARGPAWPLPREFKARLTIPAGVPPGLVRWQVANANGASPPGWLHIGSAPEVAEDAKKLLSAGFQCGFSSSWQTWIQLENLSAWHNQPFASKENGFAGLDTELAFNGPLQVRHIQQLADWSKDKTFVYGGREDKPNPKFASGECPMFMGSSGAAGTSVC